jgi:uncharacterized protein YbcI
MSSEVLHTAAERRLRVVHATNKTVAELEMAISKAMIQFEKEFMGRGPFETRSYLLDDMIVVRLKGVLLPSEIRLAESEDDQQHRARLLLKEVRQMILERARPLLESVIQDIVGVAVESLHTDISTRTGERMIIFTLKNRPVSRAAEAYNGSTKEMGSKPRKPMVL